MLQIDPVSHNTQINSQATSGPYGRACQKAKRYLNWFGTEGTYPVLHFFFLFVSYKNGIGPYGPIGNPIDFKFTERLPLAHAKTHVKNLRDISNGVVVRV